MKSGIKGYRTLNTPSPRGGGVSRNHLYLSKIHKYLRAGRRPDFFFDFEPQNNPKPSFPAQTRRQKRVFFSPAAGYNGYRSYSGMVCVCRVDKMGSLEEIGHSFEFNPCRDVNAFFMKGFYE